MSEYQYYEFQAIDHPLDNTDREALRALSTRAQITATSFTNSYKWGDFQGNPDTLMEHWFDLHLYLANWASRRLMMRWPTRLIDRDRIGAMLDGVECVTLRTAGDNLIVDFEIDELEGEDWDDGAGWLANLAPLRAAVLDGDLRLFYLAWLIAVDVEDIAPDELEPMTGLGPLTPALEAFARFFFIDSDLVAAAAEHASSPFNAQPPSTNLANPIIAAMTDDEKTDLLVRLYAGDVHIVDELRACVRQRLTTENNAPPIAPRTVGELRARADAIRQNRDRIQAEQTVAEQKQRDEEARQALRARLDTLREKGVSVWTEIETEIERRNRPGYDKAASLLHDLRVIAEESGSTEHFVHRLQDICGRHAAKKRFIERLAQTKLLDGPPTLDR